MTDKSRTLSLPDSNEIQPEEIKEMLDDMSIFLEKYAPKYEVPQISNALCNALKYIFVHASREGKANMLHNFANFFDHLVEISGMEIVQKQPEIKH